MRNVLVRTGFYRFFAVTLCDLITWPWPHKLLTLPLFVRLAICVLSAPLCIIAYLHSPFLHNALLLTIPMGLASWIFLRAGACSFYFGYALMQILYNSTIGNWSADSISMLVISSVILFIEGSAAVSLRHMLEAEEHARQMAEEGERQTRLAYEQQRQLNQVKNQFILNVNHELRTPLMAVHSYLELLQLYFKQEGSLDRRRHGEHLQKALDYCAELSQIANNVLDTMHIGSNGEPLSVESLTLAQVVYHVIDSPGGFQQQAYRTRIDISEDIVVFANVQCLRQVLHHLLSNAYKYAPADSRVTVSAEEQPETGSVCISVRDGGPGIPEHEKPLLFSQFVRLGRDLGGTVRGSGLGLYISKHLVEAMSGHIWVESDGIVGEGSRFCFTLPYQPILQPVGDD